MASKAGLMAPRSPRTGKKISEKYRTADTTNHEGFPAWTHSVADRFVQVLMTNIMEGTFYTSQKDDVTQSMNVHKEMLDADPEFYAKALVYAREHGYMREQPTFGLAMLSTIPGPLFKSVFRRVILTPSDLKKFVSYCKVVRTGLGVKVKRGVNAYLNDLSEYHALKYGAWGDQFSLANILRLCRPFPRDERQSAIFEWLVDGTVPASESGLYQIRAFEGLKTAETPEQRRALITSGRLPHEVVTGAINLDAGTWKVLLEQMPYHALLKNLNTLERHGVLADPDARKYVIGRLTDPAALVKAKVLPFRFYTALKSLETSHVGVRDALTSALDLSFENLPALTGRVMLSPDVSGSMTWSTLSKMGSTRPLDIAALFCAAMFKKCPDSRVVAFSDEVHYPKVSRHDSVMTNIERITQYGGGGTSLGAPLKDATRDGDRYDVFIGFTDNEDWVGQGFLTELDKYRKHVNQELVCFLVTLTPNVARPTPQAYGRVHYIYGWSDRVLDFISYQMSDKVGMLDAVRSVKMEG